MGWNFPQIVECLWRTRSGANRARKGSTDTPALAHFFGFAVAVFLGSEFVAFLGTVFRERENLWTFLGHQDRVLELSGEAAVLGADGPAVGLIDFGFPIPFIEHRFDRQAGTGTNDRFARLQIGKVRDAGLLVETTADSVTLELADNLVVLLLREAIDRSSDVDDSAERLDGVDADPQSIERRLNEAFGVRSDFADQERFGRVAMPAVDDARQVDVHDVAALQNVVVRDAMADDFIDASTNGIWIAVVTEARRRVAVLNGVIVGQLVDLFGGDAGPDLWTQEVHDLGIESASGSKGIAVHMSGVNRDFGQRSRRWPQQGTSEGIHTNSSMKL